MSLFKSRPEKLHKDEESASSVQKAYEKRIDHFLRDVDAPTNLLGQRDKTLDGVFSWGKRILSDKRKVERSLDEYVQAYKNSQAQVNDLKKRLEGTQARLQERESQLQKADSTIQHMEAEKHRILSQHAREKQNTLEKHEDLVARMTMDHSNTVKTLNDTHRDTERRTENEHDIRVAEMTSKHEHEVNRLNEDMKKLVAQLLVSQSDNEGWPDDKLKFKFNELRQLIDLTTSPRNREFLVPEGRTLGPRLDPTGFIGRVGSGRSHYLLKTAIWKILQEQFFSTPFGFGAFGPGKGHTEVMNVYFTWRGLFDGKKRTRKFVHKQIVFILPSNFFHSF
jgi:cell division septum initiation protein DivIVA